MGRMELWSDGVNKNNLIVYRSRQLGPDHTWRTHITTLDTYICIIIIPVELKHKKERGKKYQTWNQAAYHIDHFVHFDDRYQSYGHLLDN
jgi:hypothetical protein